MVQKYDNITFEIILVLIREKKHIRGIAKNIGTSHNTVLRQLNQLEKEGIVDYKKEGRNKIFFLKKNLKSRKLVYMAEQYKQLKLYNKYPKLEVIFNEIINKAKGIIILFGSYAKFRAKEQSDIDIYIETKDKKIKEGIESINSKISVKIGEFDTESLLIKEIINNHVIIEGVNKFYEKVRFFEEDT
ncbi:nucleotidyltransferase domain-containing protein [Candidatus Woesearchaeota archaeon]|nr:nucleotidyltransferase domain-containing protein [Candidatus Woesearchaeota archaeon]